MFWIICTSLNRIATNISRRNSRKRRKMTHWREKYTLWLCNAERNASPANNDGKLEPPKQPNRNYYSRYQTNIAPAADRERRCRRKKQTKWSKENEIKFKMYFFVYICTWEHISLNCIFFAKNSRNSSYAAAQHFVIANSSTSSSYSSLSWAALRLELDLRSSSSGSSASSSSLILMANYFHWISHTTQSMKQC